MHRHSVGLTLHSVTEMGFCFRVFSVFLDKLWKFYTYQSISDLTWNAQTHNYCKTTQLHVPLISHFSEIKKHEIKRVQTSISIVHYQYCALSVKTSDLPTTKPMKAAVLFIFCNEIYMCKGRTKLSNTLWNYDQLQFLYCFMKS